MRRVLIIEQEGWLRGILAQGFERDGFSVQAVSTPALALRALQRFAPDLIVWDLDTEDHPSLCHPLSASGTPVIYLTARGGAAPFPSLRKPFRPAHLLSLAHLSLQLRHTQNFGIVPIS
ncbi:response regulator transcription factor [Truepera radiovictrix]|uniref:Response regulator receiver protein n=1 Tax=Truepera radiovictrix (strain DSM 17093 / CIP 108686 / LMG 22925 / RQ-24) TaxID=649638 RepID=D7CQD8_TRURR|nr:response regulator transcription factor [Truepera radiovictrix]ADI14922.1 response regulator receiver protein [Truepera radiovictrix DSM 17093]WMT56527.1 response regulator transcription factor [Truepera radiovictrix]